MPPAQPPIPLSRRALLCGAGATLAGLALSPRLAHGAEPDATGFTWPWHLVDYWWNFGESRPFQSYSLDMAISPAPPAGLRLYIGGLGLANLRPPGGASTALYGGLQTFTGGFTDEAQRERQELGSGTILSRWQTRSLEAVRPAPGGAFESAGYEGDFVSVRSPFRWSTGRYRLTLRRLEEERSGSEDFTWVGLFVRDLASREEHYGGSLRFEGRELLLEPSIASFVEIYGSRRISPEAVPDMAVSFSGWRINGSPIRPTTATALYPLAVPARATTRVENGAVIAVLRPPVDRSREPGVERQEKHDRQVLDLTGSR